MDDVDFTGAANPPLVPGYRMGEPLGQGSGGRVWSAVREVDRSPVALKILSGDPVALAREVDAARSLKIPHVVPVQGLVALDDGRFAVVMDVMGGGSVREVVATRGHLSAGEAITVLVPIASALGALHTHGVVHGDVSPDNVLLDLRGRPALADLGASHALGQVDGDVWGSDGFVAPEVLLGSVPRAASDVYAVACLGLYLVTGTVPEVAPLRAPLDEWIVTNGRPDLTGHPLLAVLRDALAPEAAARPDAIRLANLAYAAAEAEPLVLVRDGDTVAGLTRRLRGALPDQGVQSPPAGTRMRRGTAGDGEVARFATTRSELRAMRERSLAAAPRAGRPLKLSARVLAVGSLAALVLLGGVAAAQGQWSGAAGQSVSTGTSPSPSLAAPTAAPSDEGGANPHLVSDGATASAADLMARVPTAEQVPRILQRLADARTALWTAPRAEEGARAAALDAVSADGSPARAADAADLDELLVEGAHLEGLRINVLTAMARTGDTQDRLIVRSRTLVSEHEVVRATGRERRAAGAVEELDLVIAWTEGGWRVWEVRGP